MDEASKLIEKLFISKVIQDKSIADVGEIQPKFLFEDKYRNAFEYIRKYHTEHGSVPTLRTFQVDNPKVELVRVNEPMSDLKKRVIDTYLTGVLLQGWSEIVPKNGPVPPLEEARNRMAVLMTDMFTAAPVNTAIDVTQNGADRLAWYQDRRDNPNTLVGVTTGFPTLDKATQGFQPGQLITVTGLPKASKSTLALLMAMAGQESGETIAYFTYEQTVDEQSRRLDAYRAGLNDNKLNSGNLDEDEWNKLVRSVHLTENYPTLVFSQNAMTVSAVAAEIDTIKPSVVIIDGVYLMDDEQGQPSNTSQAIANIVKGLHQLAMSRKICIVAVTQSTAARANGEKLNNDSIMGSRTFGQFSHVIIGIERTDDVEIRRLRILFSRSCAPCDVMLRFDYNTGTFEEVTDFELDDELEGLLEDERFDTSY